MAIICLSSCRLIGYNRVVENQPLNDPVRVVSIQNTGTIILANGKTYQIAGIRNLNALIDSWRYLQWLVGASEIREEIEVIPLYADHEARKYADVFVAVNYPRCGTPYLYLTLFPGDDPLYRRERLSHLLLEQGLCEIDPDIQYRKPWLYHELKQAEDDARSYEYGRWGNTYYFLFRLSLKDENGDHVKGRRVQVETIPGIDWTRFRSLVEYGAGTYEGFIQLKKKWYQDKITIITRIHLAKEDWQEIFRKQVLLKETKDTIFKIEETIKF